MAKRTPATPITPNALTFAYGNNLPPLNARSISVKILTKRDATGKITNANLQINYQIDADFLSLPTKTVVPGGPEVYDFPSGMVAFPSETELFNIGQNSACSVGFEGDNAYLTAKLFLTDIKRYVVNVFTL